MYPAIAKTLEQFYLLHILESFGSGTLRVKTVYDPRKKVYGPLVLEHKNKVGRNGILMEMGVLTEGQNIAGPIPSKPDGIDQSEYNTMMTLNDLLNSIDKHQKALDSNPSTSDTILGIRSIEEYIIKARASARQVKTAERKAERNFKKIKGRTGSDEAEEWWNWMKDFESVADDFIDKAEKYVRTLSNKLKKDIDAESGGKEERERKKAEDEEKAKAAKQSQTHGSYQVKDIQGISLQPTMASVKVKIHYVGGPGEGTGSAGDHDYQEISVGAKVIPVQVQNFAKIQDAILDDYFASKTTMWFRGKMRSSIRAMFKWVEYATKKLVGVDMDMAKMIKDPVTRYILLSPQGFVDASSFKHNKSAPSFYNFSSASVVFLNDDMSHESGENFFRNRSEMTKLFKSGWNTFVVLNNIDETAYFISALDGGALHILPYSYIFNTLKMDKVYDSDDFKRRSRSFQTKAGGINQLAAKLNRESTIYMSAKKALLG